MMMERLLLIKYGEIHLKGLNRPFFKRLLKQRLLETLQGLHCAIFELHGRIFVSGYDEKDEAAVIQRCRNTFGVVGVCPAFKVEKELEAIGAAAVEQIRIAMTAMNKSFLTFKVHARREDKSFSPNSEGIQREIGHYVLTHCENVKVDVHTPDVMAEVEIRDKAYVYAAVYPAVGGMPVGSSGKAMLMLSGGIDSPVAGWMMAKRGMIVSAVHFMSPPHTGEAAKQKVLDLAKQMAMYCGPVNLHLVTFTSMQEAIYTQCQPNLLTVLMRRAMIEIAQTLAQQTGAKALVTGESLGQVASQTIDALCATDDVAVMPVFRPLIGMDKTEIIEIARRIGTFAISIQPGEDCCTVFVPRHPSTRPEISKLRQEQNNIPWQTYIDACVANAQCVEIRP